MDVKPMSDSWRGGEELILVLATGTAFVPKRRHELVEIVSSLNSRSGCVEMVMRVRSNVFRLVLPSHLERVPFPVLSASLCIFSLSHTRNIGRTAMEGSTKQAEVDVSLSSWVNNPPFRQLCNNVFLVLVGLFFLKDCYNTHNSSWQTLLLLFSHQY